MSFEESVLARLQRYKREADDTLEILHQAEAVTRRFSARFFAGLEYAAVLGRQAGFEIELESGESVLSMKVAPAPDMAASVTFGIVSGAAAETDEDLMHEDLSRYSLDPSGYSGRILGWSEAAGEAPCQTFAVYADGIWKTKGLFVVKARGRVEDSEEILNGFCLRILGRLIDVAALTGGAGRRWGREEYSLLELLDGRGHPTELRWPQ